MIVMPSNNTGQNVKYLQAKYPDRIALMMNPHCIRPCQFKFNYAIDNAAFNRFDEKAYFKLLDFSKNYHPPMFIVCPDVVGCHDRTLALWNWFYPVLSDYEYKIAFVAQDGCEPELIPTEADWIFVGGRDPWKMENAHRFVGLGKPVHVGRVNTKSRLLYCESIGVTSVDGTGWMIQRGKQFIDLMEWFSGETKQLELFT